MPNSSRILWTPSPQRVEKANLTRFLSELHQPELKDYASLHAWSVSEPEAFWEAVWRFTSIKASRSWDHVLLDGDKMPGARWFTGARLNFAENLLQGPKDKPAIVAWNEMGRQSVLSHECLLNQVARLAAALRDDGVGPGDRVAGLMPNIAETVVAMLATASIGAVWSSCSPDFGVSGVLDRFGQIQPKILFSADGYVYGGNEYDSLGHVETIVQKLPALRRVIIVPNLHREGVRPGFRASLYPELLDSYAPAEIRFEQMPFDHPLYILYSSGTTGRPKCIVHGAGGTLIQHLKELVLHTDLKKEDSIFFQTTCGWMMWNWVVSSLAAGATLVLYDGSPLRSEDILFRLAEKEELAIFGTSAKYLSLIEKSGLKPSRDFDLSSLRTILSTGSPLVPESFDYVYKEVKADVCLSSISGGTDLISCFALGNPMGPVYRGELQAPGLGMKVEIFDSEGQPVRGEKGELVCTAPFPSMPVGFWGDPDGHKYHQAYFDDYPGVWRHGDWAELTENGGLIIYGRSDATLNSGGVRIGTAEIYREVEQLEEVVESLAVGQEWENDVRIVLFVRLKQGITLNPRLERSIRVKIKEGASPRHVPARIVQVADIPRTRSGKITEIAVKKVIHGQQVENVDVLANPEALELYRNLPELET